MDKKIKEILQIHDENGKYFFSGKEVAEFHSVSLNSVYSSRKVGNKLDRLLAFEKLKQLLEDDEKNKLSISGEKFALIDALTKVLDFDKSYEITYKTIS
jgi:hypothetical protein